MAASDQTYRNQKALHLVFAVTSVVMLVTTVWMFWDDYNRPFKKEQRKFRDVEAEMAKRSLLASAPDAAQRGAVVKAEKALADARAVRDAIQKKADTEISAFKTDQFKLEKSLADVKADFDSLMSYFNIEVEHRGPNSSAVQAYRDRMDAKQREMSDLKLKIEDTHAKIDGVNTKNFAVKVNGNDVEVSPDQAAAVVSAAEDAHKKETDQFDRFVKLAEQKRWGWGDWIRTWPVIDGFASPVKIQQFTLDELPIDYSFKFVTRYDRCTTCHLGMEKASYDTTSLAKLSQDPKQDADIQAKLADAIVALTDRKRVQSGKEPLTADEIIKIKDDVAHGNYGDYKHLAPTSVGLNPAHVSMYAGHPRLDLFVDANSKHPIEKFGCSACHGGQGSATTFGDATHTPDDTATRERWEKEHHWESIHFWDFPMLPRRFAEAACVKCHHQIEGLIRDQTHVEAPKLVEGYTLVRELGCFGCHEINGQKSGRSIGPDLRLEPDPPLDSLSPEERAKRLADTSNLPGTMRKVGPNLARISDKTYEDWVRQWIKAPRDFRPDTGMPHYFMQLNNLSDALKDTAEATGVDQTRFPDAEVNSIAYYLMQNSRKLLNEIGVRSTDGPEVRDADAKAVEEMTAKLADPKTTEEEKRKLTSQIDGINARIFARSQPLPAEMAVQLPPPPADDKAKADQSDRGRFLFSTKGCLACHQHSGTETAKADAQPPMPAISGESFFGPNLSRLASKLGTRSGEPQSGRKWLVGWLLNPKAHSPRTKMPVMQLTNAEADDIAAWLLSQPSDWHSNPAVNTDTLIRPDEATLKAMARVWLAKMSLTNRKLDEVLKEGKGFSHEELEGKPANADERLLEGPIDEGKLKMFVGKKAINNLGCFGCHNIPGFEDAKPIGTALNDWGKKDPARIDYADSAHFVHNNYNIVDARRDLTDEEKAAGAKSWEFDNTKPPYERQFSEGLEHEHQTREGFLHLKLQEPRSFDYNRIKNWEDRLRMPQFKFARSKPIARKDGESDEAYKQRVELEQTKAEAEAREAVMTFILGLVAEPVPAKYVYAPTGDRLAEIKGRAVLDRFNCTGCHLVQSGTYEFKLTPERYGEKTKDDGTKVPVSVHDVILEKLESKYNDYRNDANNYGADHRFPEHNAWAGPNAQPKDRIVIGGMYPDLIDDDNDNTKKNYIIRLTHALRFTGSDGTEKNLPAFTEVILPQAALIGKETRPALGGTFAEALARPREGYLVLRDSTKYGEDKSYGSAPPSLIREGEKVQSGWLFQFLKNPFPMRPITVLRMPNFGLSDDEAMALANYFAAVDRMNNPGIGLTYPYFAMPQRDSGYVEKMTGEYVERLKKANALDARLKEYQPVWADMLRDRVADMEGVVRAAQVRLEAAKKKNEGVDDAQKAVTDAEEDVKKARQKLDTSDFKDLQQSWERREAYVTESMRLVANAELCLKCHDVGTMKTSDPQGPPLNLSADRLRPDWTLRWISNPQRFMHYKSIMPANFPANAESNPFAGSFLGSEKGFTEEQIKACRDFLMIYPQVADWPVLKHRPGQGATGGK